MPLQVSDPTREYQVVDEAVLSVLESVQYVLDDIEKVTHDLICLPFYPHLSDEEVNRVIDALADITQQKDMVS